MKRAARKRLKGVQGQTVIIDLGVLPTDHETMTTQLFTLKSAATLLINLGYPKAGEMVMTIKNGIARRMKEGLLK